MTPKSNKFYVRKEYFSFFQDKDKKLLLLRMLVKKAKENLNSSESDQQNSTAFTQIMTNKDPSTGFPTQEESGNQCSAEALPEI